MSHVIKYPIQTGRLRLRGSMQTRIHIKLWTSDYYLKMLWWTLHYLDNSKLTWHNITSQKSHLGVFILTVLPLCLLSFILLTSPQSYTHLPRVTDPSLPSATSTKGPDVTDDDASVYTASSSSSSFSFSSSSSFYATSSSSSTSDKVSQLDTLNWLAVACLSGNFWLSLFFLLQFTCWSETMSRICPTYCYFPSPYIMSLLLFLGSQWFPSKNEMLLNILCKTHPTFLACYEVQKLKHEGPLFVFQTFGCLYAFTRLWWAFVPAQTKPWRNLLFI